MSKTRIAYQNRVPVQLLELAEIVFGKGIENLTNVSLPNQLLIIGASARAAAQSASNAGIQVAAIDLFGDSDLADCAAVWPLTSLSADQLETVPMETLPEDVLLTGGMECRGELLQLLAEQKNVLGPSVEAIVNTALPQEIQTACQRASILFPRFIDARHGQSPNDLQFCNWLLKPLRSTGGANVKLALNDDGIAAGQLDAGCYLQEWITGRSMSSVFCSSSCQTLLVGTTIQLTGIKRANGAQLPFAYRGSIGPIELEPEIQKAVCRMGVAIAEHFQLVGVFGIDWILGPDQTCWLIEINPRWTASCEILERASELNLISMHCQSCLDSTPVHAGQKECFRRKSQMFGKLTVFNCEPAELVVSAADVDLWKATNINARYPVFADIPQPDQRIPVDAPIMTVFATSNSVASVNRRMNDLADQIREKLKLQSQTAG